MSIAIVMTTLMRRPVEMAEAIASVMAQSVKPDEFIIVYSEGWPGEKLNQAISAAKSDHFCILCDDDKLHPDFILKTHGHSEDIVYTQMEFFGTSSCIHACRNWDLPSIKADTVPWVTSVCKKQMWHKVGGFESVSWFFDWDFWWKCYEHGATAKQIHEPLFWHRRTEEHKEQALYWDAERARVIMKHLL